MKQKFICILQLENKPWLSCKKSQIKLNKTTCLFNATKCPFMKEEIEEIEEIYIGDLIFNETFESAKKHI